MDKFYAKGFKVWMKRNHPEIKLTNEQLAIVNQLGAITGKSFLLKLLLGYEQRSFGAAKNARFDGCLTQR